MLSLIAQHQTAARKYRLRNNYNHNNSNNSNNTNNNNHTPGKTRNELRRLAMSDGSPDLRDDQPRPTEVGRCCRGVPSPGPRLDALPRTYASSTNHDRSKHVRTRLCRCCPRTARSTTCSVPVRHMTLSKLQTLNVLFPTTELDLLTKQTLWHPEPRRPDQNLSVVTRRCPECRTIPVRKAA